MYEIFTVLKCHIFISRVIIKMVMSPFAYHTLRNEDFGVFAIILVQMVKAKAVTKISFEEIK